VALVVPTRKPVLTGTCIPFGLAYIASYLKKEIPSCEVKIIDGEIGQDVETEIFVFQPNIVGVSASTVQALDAYSLGDMLRLNRPDILTVIGGVHASALPSEALEHFDCVVVGEGETVFAQIVRGFMDGKRANGIIDGVQVDDLNSLPQIDYDSLNVKEYLAHGLDLPLLLDPCMNINTSRGCHFRCPFCHNSGRTTDVRYFSAERVSGELLLLHNKFGVNRFYFSDDEFLINTGRLKELKTLFDQKGISGWLSFGCQARSKTLTVPTLELAKSMGCVLVSIGLESGCQRTLDYLKQGTTTLADHEQALRNCGEVGVLAGGNFIFGVFDQTLEEMRESFRWLTEQRNICFVGTGVLIPYPDTEVWRKSQELKLLPKNVVYSRLVLTYYIRETYVLNQVVPLKVFAKFMVHTARMARLYAKRNLLKSSWRFTVAMCWRPVFYWAWLFHPLQMFKLIFWRKQK
jgi:anaerobic magnesium-protoporphyrin IX monomethyl ester cyclase